MKKLIDRFIDWWTNQDTSELGGCWGRTFIILSVLVIVVVLIFKLIFK